MRRFLFIFCILCPVIAYSLTIPKGTLYFDNSKTNYSAIRFVYGSDTRQETYAVAMTADGKKWRADIPAQVNNMYRFTFVGGDIKTGLYHQDFNTFKDSISHQANLNRTATSDAQMQAGDIFVPQTADNWAQGSWMSLNEWETPIVPGGASVTGTLPIVYVNTENQQPVVDKETQIPASVYIDAKTGEYPSLGSTSAPISATIKGRGNWTWSGFDKKPYKLKFSVKQKVLGMPNNKHWCLLACADDYLGFMKMPAGFYLSEAIGLRWTPRMRPVELVLNGNYMGLYFLTEHVRIASNRVNITEQADNELVSSAITGGWLIEIDNYPTENNITFYEGNGQFVMISLREPEVLSSIQRTYLVDQVMALNDALYGSSSERLEELLDLEEAAKYYLVQEIMEDCESYHGSCFLYKDRDSLGIADKWKFGPVWDFGNAYDRHQERWIYDSPSFAQYWIGQLATWPAFQDKVQEQWYLFYHSYQDTVRTQIQSLADKITPGAKNDALVWDGTQNYRNNSDMQSRLNDFLWRFDWRIQWLYKQWGEGKKPAEEVVPSGLSEEACLIPYRKALRDGQVVIQRGDQVFSLTGQQIR